MNGWQVGRRGTLSGALAAVVAGSAAAVPGIGVAWPGGRPLEAREGAGADETQARRDEADAAAPHTAFRTAFLMWLDGAAERFALPVSVVATSPTHTRLRIAGIHPAIRISLGHDRDVNVGADWEDMNWDVLACMDVTASPAPDGGWENTFMRPKFRVSHPTREAAWRSDGFEPLLDWVNEELAPATHLALWGSDEGGSWAWLTRDGASVSTGRPIASEGAKAPVHLLPLHVAGAAARVQRVGQARRGDHDGDGNAAIGSAVQRGNHVHVYDERGRQLTMIEAGRRPEEGLTGYTGATVSIRRGDRVLTYDERGRQLSTTSAR